MMGEIVMPRTHKIVFIIIITFMVVADILVHIYCCRLQLFAANTRPLAIPDKETVYNGLLSLILIVDERLIEIYFLILIINLYAFRDRIRSMLKIDVKMLFLPMIVINLAIIIGFWIIIFRWPFLIDFDSFYMASVISTVLLLVFGIYMVVYHIPGYVERKLVDRIVAGLSMGLSSSFLSLILMFLVHVFWDPVLYECSTELLGISCINPNSIVFEELNTIRLSGILAYTAWLLLYSWFYHQRTRY